MMMNLLNVGPNPLRSGGVAFYQRALHEEFIKHKINPFYLGVDQIDHSKSESFITQSNQDSFSRQIFDLVLCKGVYFGAVDPLYQISESSANSAFKKFILDNEIKVVHFHATRPASLIKVAKNSNCKVVVSLHDYWYLCSLGFRVLPNRKLCHGDNGKKCAQVCDSFSRDREDYVIKNKFNKFIRSKIKASLKFIMGNKYNLIENFLQRNTQKILPAVNSIESNSGLSPVMLHPESEWISRQSEIINLLNDYTDEIIAVSQIVYDRHVESGIKSNKISVLNSGYEDADSAFFSKSRSVKRPINKHEINLIFISPLYPEKGLHILLDAIQLIKNKNKIKLNIYGKKELWSKGYWEKIIFNLPANVNFYGTFEYNNLPLMFARSDISIVCPIMQDPSPRVVWESLAAGVPVVASRESGASDFIEHGVNGLLFTSGSSEELASCIDKLYDESNLVENLQKNIKPLKTISKHSLELIKLYND